jgi:hypothetical protein
LDSNPCYKDVGAEGDFQGIDGTLTFSETAMVWSGTIQANAVRLAVGG